VQFTPHHKEKNHMAEKNVTDRSAEYARLVKAAEVGAEAPETTSEKPGLHLSGGEENNGAVKG
jgi:hypothetical protein